MIKKESLLEIGCFNKPHGVNGEISATFDYMPEELADVRCYICDINGIFVPFFAKSKRPKNNQTILLKMEGVDSENDLKHLVNKKIYALKEEVNLENFDDCDDDELPLDYFIGYEVCESDKGSVGKIVDVDTSTENYLFIVEKDDRKFYIPAVDELIEEINFDNKKLIMNLPTGLLEM